MQYKRILNQFVSILMIVCMVCLMVIPIRADWIASAGGKGTAGTVKTGNYNAKMQGIRITIIDKYGNPALVQDHHTIL